MDKFLLILIMVGIVSGQLVQLPVLGTSIPLVDIALAISFLVLLFKIDFSFVRLISFKVFVGFLSILLLSLLVNLGGLTLSEVLTSGAYLARLVVYGLVGFMLWPILQVRNKNFYLSTLGVSFSIFVGVSFLQFGLFPNFEIFEYLGWDPHRLRLVGTFFDPNFSSVFLSFGILLSVLVLLQTGIKQWQWLLTLMLSFAGILATTSRTGLLALLAGATALIIFIRSKIGWAFLGVLLLSVLLVPQIQNRLVDAFSGDSLKFRQESWAEGWQLTKENPWFGVGYNTLSKVRQTTVLNEELLGSNAMSGFDSSLLTISATSGFVGLIFFLFFVFSLVLKASKKMVLMENIFSRWFVLGTVSLAVASIFINAWLYPPLLACWFVMMSLSLLETNR